MTRPRNLITNTTFTLPPGGLALNLGSPRPKMQGRARDQDRRGRVKWSCSSCEIQYYLEEGMKALCPLCEQNQVTQQVRGALFQVQNANNMLQNELASLKSLIDHLTAMKMAFEVLGPEDLTFVKSVVYRWQADRDRTTLKPLHGKKGRKIGTITGFLLITRDGEGETHVCNSVGGMALASYLGEAYGLYGQKKAMEIFIRASLQHLEARIE